MAQINQNKTDLAITLEVARRDLLDLSLRNPLLNYKVPRTKGVEITNGKPEDLFRVLVHEEKRMTFLPCDSRKSNGSADDPLLAQPDEEAETSSRHAEVRIQTAYTAEQLQSRLLATYRTARTTLEEHGANTLYLVLGMLRWRDDDKSEEYFSAPLVLIPVSLERGDARERFRLKYSGEELGENISLVEKLKREFGAKEFPRLAEAEDVDVEDYFESVRKAIKAHPGWSVDAEAITLGFFSFAKFLMYRDLDPETWPADQSVLEHALLVALLGDSGFQPFEPTFQADGLLDDQCKDRELVQVVDADSSQTIALLEASDGHSMVIQGPPGTGKSQTIVNLIAAAVATGKKVLFVSEKMAALDVVKQRLDKLRLGGPCLELHSNRTNKKTLIDELKRTISIEKQAAPDLRTELSLLTDSRDKLNAYCKDVNEPIGDTEETPRSVYGKRLSVDAVLKEIETPVLRIDAAAHWPAVESVRRRLAVKQLQDRVAVAGIPPQHPFWGSRLTQILPSEKDELHRVISHARDVTAGFESVARKLAESCRVPPSLTPAEATILQNSAKHILSAPDLGDVNRQSSEWTSRESHIREILKLGRRHRDLRRQYDSTLRKEAWSYEITEVRQTCAQLGGKWWRFFSSRWRRAKREIAFLCIAAPPPKQVDQLSLLDAIAETAAAAARVEAAKYQMTTLFGSGWMGLSSDCDELESKASWVISARRGIQAGTLASWCISQDPQSLDHNDIGRRTQEFEAGQKAFGAALKTWIEKLQIDEARFETPLLSQSFSALVVRWEGQGNRVDDLQTLVALNQASTACAADGLEALIPITWKWAAAGTHLVFLYERARLTALLDRAFTERPSLALFSGETQQEIVNHFRQLDILQLEHRARLISARHAESLPSGGGNGEIGTLWREFQKRGRFLPIRSLMLKAGHAIQSIKPVFMMSPLSIANYLPPGALTFDLIIFDEASQVRPVDALGAIARGKQAVVVGDSKQMPPTSFFDSLVDLEDPEDQDEVATSDVESILGLFCARGAHERMLRWHYRSRHESLITVSNHLFYDDQLVIFPSPQRERNGLGLIYRYLENAHYDRGRTRTNPTEAKTVAAAVMAHARNQLKLPREKWETLGVAAFSLSQMTAIEDQLESLRRRDPSCEDFFSYPPHESFFVKNLESVQGDERDVIFISVGYGRTAEGFLSMGFGPLNRTGGERRLNVLISRARKRCEVFTNLKAEDIDIPSNASIGVAALKTFLHYAETGQLDVPAQTDRPPDSEFEEHVLRRLTALGYNVHSQVGSAGFFLDLAVVDPAKPGRYLLGIECDGASYHSAQSARDRDRLRQAVLEGLGWKIHRIWSTDWFHHPDQELAKIVKAIESAKAGGPTNPTPSAPTLRPDRPEPTAKVVPINAFQRKESVVAYPQAEVRIHLGSVEMHLVDRAQLAALIANVVNVESPVHRTEAARRVLNGAGLQRFGSRIQQAFDDAIVLGASSKLFVMRKEFLWTLDMKESPVRDRSELPAASRKMEFVAPEEIRHAILLVVQESHGIAPEEVAGATCRLLGFARVTDDMSAVVARQRDGLVGEGLLALRGVNLVAASSEVAKGA